MESENIRKALTLHLIMVRNMKAMNGEANNRDKKLLREIVCRDRILKKYKLWKYAQGILEMKLEKANQTKTTAMDKNKVDYFGRDNNSRIMRKCTITRHGSKKQIRLLNDSIKNIHEKFLSEQRSEISYSLFCRLKPFYVIKPTEKHRETCLCKHHENIQFMINKIFHERAIEINYLDELLKKITCNSENKACIYRECDGCRDKSLTFKHADGRQVFWNSWKNVRLEKEKKNKNETVEKRKTVKTMKEKEFGTLENLENPVQNDLKRVGRHVYNIRHQYRAIESLENHLDIKKQLSIWTSQKISSKCRSEIQGMHFGASQRQISLHTGMIYYRYTSQSFTTLSDNMYHGPAAIWPHLKPVLRRIAEIKNIERIHFVSDGPTTQYRSKNNFFFHSKIIFEFCFKSAIWNFWEAGHGKGALNGIGLCVKRLADSLVLHDKQDITKAAELLEGLAKLGTKIDLYKIEQTDIDLFNVYKDAKITSVPETMKIHQINTPYAMTDTAIHDDQSTSVVKKNTVLLKVNEVDESLIGRLWYEKSKVVALLSGEPEHVTKRHCQIDQVVWKAITDEMDIE
ncbi:LOW QUALITY PROTEIN: hypothetical protein MAR_011304 [Mya arenaria]|uniref:Uncharacterized protein n=1 Tax=Mya arenaria TaxID=6604 RepID=A0ABY7FTQ8_MYAAR|nr:LOW QUALITY PROTEIN: hypothetical protein MAR_011304 [Mya arenaria]